MKDIVFCLPGGFLSPDEDVIKALSDRSGIDERQTRKILNGNVDFKISFLNRIAEGLDLVTFSFPSLNRLVSEEELLILARWLVISGRDPVKRQPKQCPVFSESKYYYRPT